MTKGTYYQPNSFGDVERCAQRLIHSDHRRTRVQSVFQIGITLMEFIEVFHSMTKCRIRHRTVTNIGRNLSGKNM